MAETLLYVALDKNTRQDNLSLAGQLSGSGIEGNFGYKINLDHALMWGEKYLKLIVDSERPVFVDLKMNNGSRTMTNIVSWLGDLGVDHTNVWAHAEANLAKTMEAVSGLPIRPSVLGVTFYTRWDEDYARRNYGMGLDELIRHWSQVAVDCGADGIILPPNYYHAVEGIDTAKLSPAIRKEGETTGSIQEQTATPYDAVMAGADILVVGSPIYGAIKPVDALIRYMSEMRRGEEDRALLVDPT